MQTSCCLAAGWDGAYIGGATAENKCFYTAGETMTFRLQVGGIAALPAGTWTLRWTRTGDDGVTQTGTAPVSLTEPCVVTTSLDRPGFVRIQASIDGVSNAVRFDGGAGVDFANIVANQGEPADFEGFWRRQLAALGKVAIAPQLTEIASPKSGVKLYTFSLGCVGEKPATGYLSVPDAAGPFPVRLLFYGYNQSWTTAVLQPPAAGDLSASEIQLRVNAHGLELNRDSAYYNAAKASVSYESHVHGWNPAENERPETCYYLNMILRDVRAAQYAQTLAKWNGRDLIVAGGSQGAFQSVLVASLCPQVTSAEVYINWLCDLRGKALGGRLASEFQPEYRPGLDYFDEVFHARRVSTNCYVNVTYAGLGDYISPPTGIACFYNALRGKKRIVWRQNAEHSWQSSAPGQASVTFSAEKQANPAPDVDWRDLEVSSCTVTEGYNFTNEIVTVNVSDAGAYAGTDAALRVTVRDARGVVVATRDALISGDDTSGVVHAAYKFNLGVTPGGRYSYAVTLVDGNGVPLERGDRGTGSFFTGRIVPSFFAHAAVDETNGGAWSVKPPVVDGRYHVTAKGTGGDFSISDRRTGVVRMTSRVTVTGGHREADLPSVLAGIAAQSPRGALLLVDGSVSYWARLAKTQDGYAAVRLKGMENPVDGGEYEITVETDTSRSPAVVGYWVGPVGGASVQLSDEDGNTWFALEDGEQEGVAGVQYRGELSLAALDGERDDDAAYTVEGANLELNTNVWLNPAGLATGAYALLDNGHRFRWSDDTRYMTYDAATGRYVVSETAPANGLPGFESYALGLDAADATSVPKLDIASGSEGNFRLEVKNGTGTSLAPRTVPGVSVGYVLERSSDVAFTDSVVGPEQASPVFNVPAEGQVGFFRAKINLNEE